VLLLPSLLELTLSLVRPRSRAHMQSQLAEASNCTCCKTQDTSLAGYLLQSVVAAAAVAVAVAVRVKLIVCC
jgi:hypothetical protein